DVVAHPFESGPLIHQTVIAGGVTGILIDQCTMGEETKGSEPVKRRHDDHAGFGSQLRSIVANKISSGACERSGMKNNNDRRGTAWRRIAHPYVDAKAVFRTGETPR